MTHHENDHLSLCQRDVASNQGHLVGFWGVSREVQLEDFVGVCSRRSKNAPHQNSTMPQAWILYTKHVYDHIRLCIGIENGIKHYRHSPVCQWMVCIERVLQNYIPAPLQLSSNEFLQKTQGKHFLRFVLQHTLHMDKIF